MLEVSNRTTWRRFYRHLECHNAVFEEREFMTCRFRCGWKSTAEQLVRRYLAAKRNGELVGDGWFETSNALIAQATRYPINTVKDHINRLIEIEFILGKVKDFDGALKSNGNNFFLKINPGTFATPQPHFSSA